MGIILNIDTAVQTASVCLSENEKTLGQKINLSQKDHAPWLHIAIKELLEETDFGMHQLSAIAISAGPGSYTGLRVAMATAKGLCYVLKIPLININTLQIMAKAALEIPSDFICPMIDARRMEVFTALFDHSLIERAATVNKILDENSFNEILDKYRVVFCGNGSKKFQLIVNHPNAFFADDVNTLASDMVPLSLKKLGNKEFSDLAYSEPAYGKEFYSPSLKPVI